MGCHSSRGGVQLLGWASVDGSGLVVVNEGILSLVLLVVLKPIVVFVEVYWLSVLACWGMGRLERKWVVGIVILVVNRSSYGYV